MHIKVIIGPPCAGKSTHVQEHAAPGDPRLDYDAIAKALGSPTDHDAPQPIRDLAFTARNAVIQAILTDTKSNATAWIIHTQPTDEQLAAYLEADAELLTINPGKDTCLQRAQQDGRPERTTHAINTWYERETEKSNIALALALTRQIHTKHKQTLETTNN